MNNLVKPAIETAIEYIPFFGPFVVKAFENYETDIYNSHVIDRINRVEAAIKKMDNYDSKIHWIESNENKLIVVRKYLENLFYYIDPALLDINIKIFVDYVDDKKIKNEYDYFLEKVVFLNRYSFKVLKQISNCEKDSEYYKWDDLLKQYNINEDLKYYHFINKDNKNEVDMVLVKT